MRARWTGVVRRPVALCKYSVRAASRKDSYREGIIGFERWHRRDLTKSHDRRRNESVRQSIAMPMSAAESLSRGVGMVISLPTGRSRDLRARQFLSGTPLHAKSVHGLGHTPVKGGTRSAGAQK
jgi:hypothetical protein